VALVRALELEKSAGVSDHRGDLEPGGRLGRPRGHIAEELRAELVRDKITQLAGGKPPQARHKGNGRTQARIDPGENGYWEASMATLPLAMDIAETVERAADDGGFLHVDAAVDALIEAHPDAGVTHAEVAEVLREEGAATGVIPPKPRPVP
jgi:hypothetical protein